MALPPVAPGLQNQQFGKAENIRSMPPATTMPAQPMPMPPRQPRPSLIVGGPAYFTPEGYQAPVQPEQAFMPTDTRPDPIGENFRRQYPDRPMPPPPMPIPQPQPEPPFDPGPITGRPAYPSPTPTPTPAPQPEYDPYAQSDLGKRALGGEYINSKTFHWFDPTTGKSGSTTEGWSRVPDAVKGYTYLDAESASDAKQKFMTFEDRGSAPELIPTPITTPAPTPITETPVASPVLPAPAPIRPDMDEFKLDPNEVPYGPGHPVFDAMAKVKMGNTEETTVDPVTAAVQAPKELTLPSGKTIDLAQIQASLAGLNIPNIQMPEPLKVPAPAPTATGSSMLGGSMLGMSADALRAEGGTPQPSTGGGLFGKLGASGISTMDSPPRQIATPIPNASPVAPQLAPTPPVAVTPPAPVQKRAPLPFDLEPQIRDETAQVERPLQERAPIAPISEPRMPDPLTPTSGPTLAPASPVAPQLAPQLGPPSVAPSPLPAPDLPNRRQTPKTRLPITAPGLPIPSPGVEPTAPALAPIADPIQAPVVSPPTGYDDGNNALTGDFNPYERVTGATNPVYTPPPAPVAPPQIEQIEQIKQVIPQLPVEQLQEVIPQLPPEVIQEVIPQLPPEVIQQVLPQLPPEVIENLTMFTPQVSFPSPMMPRQTPNFNTRRMNPRLPTR
jgi:hypothetical protein